MGLFSNEVYILYVSYINDFISDIKQVFVKYLFKKNIEYERIENHSPR